MNHLVPESTYWGRQNSTLEGMAKLTLPRFQPLKKEEIKMRIQQDKT